MPSGPKLEDAVTGQHYLLGDTLQASNDPSDFFGKLHQGSGYFEILSRRSIAERYVKYDLSVVLELGLKTNSFTKRVRPRNGDIENVNGPVFVLQFDAHDPSDGDDRNEELVFVVNVQGVQRENVAVPSFVTFDVVNYEIEDARSGRYASTLLENRFKPVFGLARIDGKFRVPVRVAESSNDFAPRDVKSGSQIVDCIARNQCEVGTQVSVSERVVKELFPRLSIHVQAGSVTVGRGVESLLEIRDVLIGPFDL